MSSPGKSKPSWRDRLRDRRQAREQKVVDRGRSDHAAREAMRGKTPPPSGGTGSHGSGSVGG